MPIPEKQAQYYEKDFLDKVIDNVAAQDSPITSSDLNRVIVAAQIQEGIDRYRDQAKNLLPEAIYAEEHNSVLLATHLEQAGKPRPPKCHAHAIVAGKHKYAADLRLVMSKLKIRIDDVDNGCWLPENTAATPHPAFPSALPHSRIHRFNYYFWINSHLIRIGQEKVFRAKLRLITRQLQYGGRPDYVMLKKGIGLPR